MGLLTTMELAENMTFYECYGPNSAAKSDGSRVVHQKYGGPNEPFQRALVYRVWPVILRERAFGPRVKYVASVSCFRSGPAPTSAALHGAAILRRTVQSINCCCRCKEVYLCQSSALHRVSP